MSGSSRCRITSSSQTCIEPVGPRAASEAGACQADRGDNSISGDDSISGDVQLVWPAARRMLHRALCRGHLRGSRMPEQRVLSDSQGDDDDDDECVFSRSEDVPCEHSMIRR